LFFCEGETGYWDRASSGGGGKWSSIVADMFKAKALWQLMISAYIGLASDVGQNNGYKLLPSQMSWWQSAKNDLKSTEETNEELKKWPPAAEWRILNNKWELVDCEVEKALSYGRRVQAWASR
jgi:hypothetical protein